MMMMMKSLHTIPKSISSKVNAQVPLEFELAYYDVAFQHINYYAIGTQLEFSQTVLLHQY